jgi:hypothetical protein
MGTSSIKLGFIVFAEGKANQRPEWVQHAYRLLPAMLNEVDLTRHLGLPERSILDVILCTSRIDDMRV